MADKQRVPPERTRGEGEQKKSGTERGGEFDVGSCARPGTIPLSLLTTTLQKIYAWSLSIPLLLSRSLQRGRDDGWRGMGRVRDRGRLGFFIFWVIGECLLEAVME